MVYMNTNEADRGHILFLDSGCSNHMCGKRDIFSDLDNNFRESVKLGNDLGLTVIIKGNIRMEIKWMIQVVTRVFYVPELKNNDLQCSCNMKNVRFFNLRKVLSWRLRCHAIECSQCLHDVHHRSKCVFPR